MKKLSVSFYIFFSFLTIYRPASCQVVSNGIHIRIDTTLSLKYLHSGLAKYKVENYSEALEDFKIAVKYNPGSGTAFRLRGETERQLEQYDSAVKSYTKALTINHSDAMSFKGRAESQRFRNNCKGALNDYDKAIELNPNDPDMYFGRGCCDYNLNMHDQCISDFTEYLKQRPHSTIARFFRGVSFSLINKNHEAIKDLSKYLLERKNDETPAAYYFRGTSYTALTDEDITNADSAISDLKKFLAEVPDHASSYKFLGFAYSAKGDSLMARKCFKQAIVLKPDDGQIYYNWGNLELVYGNYSKAVELYDLAAAKEAIAQMNDLYCQSGLAKAELKDTVGALSDFAKSLQADSNYLKTYEKRVNLIIGIPKYDKIAIHDLTKMIWLYGLLDPNDMITVSYYYSLRGMVNFRMGNRGAAIEDEDKAVSLTPKYAYSYLMRAFVGISMGSKDKMSLLSDIDTAISLDNERWDAYVLKSFVMDFFGVKTKENCECVKRAVQLGGPITKELVDYYCKEKKSKNAIGTFAFTILPHIQKVKAKK